MEVKYSKPKVKFDSVDIGECFIYGTEIYIKVSRIYNSANSFNTYSDYLCTLYKDTIVQPVDAELLISW